MAEERSSEPPGGHWGELTGRDDEEAVARGIVAFLQGPQGLSWPSGGPGCSGFPGEREFSPGHPSPDLAPGAGRGGGCVLLWADWSLSGVPRGLKQWKLCQRPGGTASSPCPCGSREGRGLRSGIGPAPVLELGFAVLALADLCVRAPHLPPPPPHPSFGLRSHHPALTLSGLIAGLVGWPGGFGLGISVPAAALPGQWRPPSRSGFNQGFALIPLCPGLEPALPSGWPPGSEG